MKVYKVRGCTPLSKYELEGVKKLNPEVFIYNYEYESWEGSGFALWKKGNKFGYSYMGHCSCYGPLEDLKSIMYSFAQIKKLAKADNYEWKYAGPVIERMEAILREGKL